jgi:DNA polymerase
MARRLLFGPPGCKAISRRRTRGRSCGGLLRSIFNPARPEAAAMRAEMPVKYWKNLPKRATSPG